MVERGPPHLRTWPPDVRDLAASVAALERTEDNARLRRDFAPVAELRARISKASRALEAATIAAMERDGLADVPTNGKAGGRPSRYAP